jgi:hypothetical protein
MLPAPLIPWKFLYFDILFILSPEMSISHLLSFENLFTTTTRILKGQSYNEKFARYDFDIAREALATWSWLFFSYDLWNQLTVLTLNWSYCKNVLYGVEKLFILMIDFVSVNRNNFVSEHCRRQYYFRRSCVKKSLIFLTAKMRGGPPLGPIACHL